MRWILLCLLSPCMAGAQQVPTRVSFPSSEWVEPFPVTIHVAKGDLTGFGKVQLSISPPADVTVISRQEATFSSSDGQAKFLWMDMPKGDLELSILVTPRHGEAKRVTISGAFYYLGPDGNPRQDGIDQSLGGQKEGTGAMAQQTEKTMQPEAGRRRDRVAPPAPEQGAAPESTPGTDPETTAPQRREAQQAQRAAPAAPEPVRQAAPRPAAAAPQPSRANTSAPGVVFRAQVSAQKRYQQPTAVAEHLGLAGEVHYERHEGWHKYTTGDFTNYRAAKTYANQLRETNQVPGSFVVGVENGQRITVQRAIELAR